MRRGDGSRRIDAARLPAHTAVMSRGALPGSQLQHTCAAHPAEVRASPSRRGTRSALGFAQTCRAVTAGYDRRMRYVCCMPAGHITASAPIATPSRRGAHSALRLALLSGGGHAHTASGPVRRR